MYFTHYSRLCEALVAPRAAIVALECDVTTAVGCQDNVHFALILSEPRSRYVRDTGQSRRLVWGTVVPVFPANRGATPCRAEPRTRITHRCVTEGVVHAMES